MPAAPLRKLLSLLARCPGGWKLAFLAVLAAIPVSAAGAGAAYSHLWSGFATPLAGRSVEQRKNADRAARDLDGTIIPAGSVFSFNELVGGRDREKGYLRAPMINDAGNLEEVAGGGICQLATTVYNAALEAGLEIVERHPHSRAITYVPPGRDATIVTWRKDLRLRNPHPVPLLLRIRRDDRRLTASFWSVAAKPFRVEIRTDAIPVEPETALAAPRVSNGLHVQPGREGFSVVTTRIVHRGDLITEEIVSRDYYPPPSRLIAGDAP